MNENEIGTIIVDMAIYLHKKIGPGLFENVYEVILAKLLTQKGLKVQRQVPIPIQFEDQTFEEGYKADLLVEDKVIIEIKSMDKIEDIHKKQVLTYIRLKNIKLGYVLNFGSELMKDGVVRVINGRIE